MPIDGFLVKGDLTVAPGLLPKFVVAPGCDGSAQIEAQPIDSTGLSARLSKPIKRQQKTR